MSNHRATWRAAGVDPIPSLGARLMRSFGKPFAASAVLGAVFAPSIAKAQSNEDVNDVSFEMQARYDSNVARSGEARANLRGLERSDFRVSPTVTVDIARSFGRTRATLAGSIAYDFFARNDELNRERIALEGGLSADVGLCTPSIGASLARAQSDLGDIAFVSGAPLVAVKNTQTVQRYSAELACGSEFGLRPFGGIEYERGDNSNVVRQRADFDATTYRTGLRYVSPTLGQISLFASRRDSDLGGLRPLGDTGKSRSTSYGVGFSRNLGTRFEASAQIAHSDVDYRGPATNSGFSGLTWDFQLTAIAGSRLRVVAAVGREISNNISSDATFVVRSPYSLRAMYALNGRLQADAGVAVIRQRYRYAIAPALIFIQRDRRETYDAGISYKFARRLSLRVSGGHERRRANDAFFNFNNTFAIASVGFSL